MLLDMISLPRLMAAAGILIILNILRRRLQCQLAHVPGPELTKWTDLYMTFFIVRGIRFYHVHELHKIYGPIVRVSPTEVSVADPEAAKLVHQSFNKSDFYDHIFAMTSPNVFITRDLRYHAKWRKLLGNSLSLSNMKNLETVVQSKVSLMIAQMKTERKLRGFVDLHKWMYCFTADVIGALAFGKSFGVLEKGEDNDYVKATRTFLPLSILCGIITSLPYRITLKWPVQPFSSLKRVITHLDTAAAKSLEQYRQHVASTEKPPPMLFDNIMGAKGVKAGATEAEIISNAQVYIMAGTDTTGVSLIYLLWAIFGRPGTLAKILKEIDDANLPATPKHEDVLKLKYLENLLDETLRVYSPVPGPLPRSVPPGGRTLCGYYIPEGLTASPIAYSVQRDPILFPNPDEWIPERWDNATREMRDAILCFGGGTRICIGMHLAKMEIRMAVVAILRAFGDAKLAYGTEGFSEAGMVQVDSITAKPKSDKVLIA